MISIYQQTLKIPLQQFFNENLNHKGYLLIKLLINFINRPDSDFLI